MVPLKKALIVVFFILPLMCFGQVDYKSTEAGFSIPFPEKPYEKIGTHTTEIMYEDDDSGLLYVVSFKPYSGEPLKGKGLETFVKEQLTKDAPNIFESINSSKAGGRESVRVSMKADYEHYQIHYKLEYLIVNGYEFSIGIMSPEDKITFDELDEFVGKLKFN